MSNRNHIKLILTLTLVLVGGVAAKAQNEVVVDRVVAVVGKNIVKFSDIEDNYVQIRRHQGYANAYENRCKILESLMLTKLLVHKGELDSIEVTDEQVEEQVQYYLKPMLRQYGTKEAMKAATGYTYDEIHDKYFALLKDKIMSEQVEYGITKNVKITPREVTEYYNKIPKDSLPEIPEEFEISEIELHPQVSEAERERVKMQLAQLRERVLKGEKFEMLATLYSEDPGSAKKGGELGFFGRGDMVSEFEAAAFALKPGEVSPIIETQFGFHIVQLIERRGNTVNARHILLSPKVSAEDLLKTRIRLDSIATEIKAGRLAFDEAARNFSDAQNARQGGVATNPQSGNNRFGTEIAKMLYPGIPITNMKEGDVSNATAMKTEDNTDAYRIIRVNKRINAHTANLVDDYDKLYDAALGEAKNKKLLEWAQKMIKNTYVRIIDDYKDCDFQLNWTNK